jgi:hypothetical protein
MTFRGRIPHPPVDLGTGLPKLPVKVAGARSLRSARSFRGQRRRIHPQPLFGETINMLRKILLMFVASATFVAPSFAQDAQARARFQGKSSIAVTIDGLTCNNSQGTIPGVVVEFWGYAEFNRRGAAARESVRQTLRM